MKILEQILLTFLRDNFTEMLLADGLQGIIGKYAIPTHQWLMLKEISRWEMPLLDLCWKRDFLPNSPNFGGNFSLYISLYYISHKRKAFENQVEKIDIPNFFQQLFDKL